MKKIKIFLSLFMIIALFACNSPQPSSPQPAVAEETEQTPIPPPPQPPKEIDYSLSKLTITTLTPPSSAVNLHSNFNINVTVKNFGSGPSGIFTVETRAILINNPMHAMDLPLGSATGQGLAAGEEKQLVINVENNNSLTLGGIYKITVSIVAYRSGIETNSPEAQLIVN